MRFKISLKRVLNCIEMMTQKVPPYSIAAAGAATWLLSGRLKLAVVGY